MHLAPLLLATAAWAPVVENIQSTTSTTISPCERCHLPLALTKPAYGFDLAPIKFSAAVRYPNGSTISLLTIDADPTWQSLMWERINNSTVGDMNAFSLIERIIQCPSPKGIPRYVWVPRWLPLGGITGESIWAGLFPSLTFSSDDFAPAPPPWWCRPARASSFRIDFKACPADDCLFPRRRHLQAAIHHVVAAVEATGAHNVEHFGYAVPDFARDLLRQGFGPFNFTARPGAPETNALARLHALATARGFGLGMLASWEDPQRHREELARVRRELVLTLAVDALGLHGALDVVGGERSTAQSSENDAFSDPALASQGVEFHNVDYLDGVQARVRRFIDDFRSKWDDKLHAFCKAHRASGVERCGRMPITRVLLVGHATASAEVREWVRMALPEEEWRRVQWHWQASEDVAARGMARIVRRQMDMPLNGCVETEECRVRREEVRNGKGKAEGFLDGIVVEL